MCSDFNYDFYNDIRTSGMNESEEEKKTIVYLNHLAVAFTNNN